MTKTFTYSDYENHVEEEKKCMLRLKTFVDIGDVIENDVVATETDFYEAGGKIKWEVLSYGGAGLKCEVTFPPRIDGRRSYKDGKMTRDFSFKKALEVFENHEEELKLKKLGL